MLLALKHQHPPLVLAIQVHSVEGVADINIFAYNDEFVTSELLQVSKVP